jgi:hypothetical protein
MRIRRHSVFLLLALAAVGLVLLAGCTIDAKTAIVGKWDGRSAGVSKGSDVWTFLADGRVLRHVTALTTASGADAPPSATGRDFEGTYELTSGGGQRWLRITWSTPTTDVAAYKYRFSSRDRFNWWGRDFVRLASPASPAPRASSGPSSQPFSGDATLTGTWVMSASGRTAKMTLTLDGRISEELDNGNGRETLSGLYRYNATTKTLQTLETAGRTSERLTQNLTVESLTADQLSLTSGAGTVTYTRQ